MSSKTFPNGVEVEDFGDVILVHNFPESLDPYDQLMYCENQEHEGGDSYRFEGVYPELKKKFLNSLKNA